jgi:hypothetical protein
MSDNVFVAKAECSTQFTIERENGDITLTLKMAGLPDIVLDRIVEKGEDMTMVIIQAVMASVGAIGVQQGPNKTKSDHHKASVH